MNQMLGVWKCECCSFSNPNESKRCSYCDLPKDHTAEQLEKYKQAFQDTKASRKEKNLFVDLFQFFVEYIFLKSSKTAIILLIALLSVIPMIKDNILLMMPVAMMLGIIVWGYFYMKKG